MKANILWSHIWEVSLKVIEVFQVSPGYLIRWDTLKLGKELDVGWSIIVGDNLILQVFFCLIPNEVGSGQSDVFLPNNWLASRHLLVLAIIVNIGMTEKEVMVETVRYNFHQFFVHLGFVQLLMNFLESLFILCSHISVVVGGFSIICKLGDHSSLEDIWKDWFFGPE
jgi:hypothetical protein